MWPYRLLLILIRRGITTKELVGIDSTWLLLISIRRGIKTINVPLFVHHLLLISIRKGITTEPNVQYFGLGYYLYQSVGESQRRRHNRS